MALRLLRRIPYLLIVDDYPRVIVLIDGVEVLTLNVG